MRASTTRDEFYMYVLLTYRYNDMYKRMFINDVSVINYDVKM